MKLLLVKQFDNSFKVAYDSDYDKLKRIKPNEFVECEIKKKRNIMFHRKFFALLNLLYQNQERYNNIDHLRNDLTIEAGYYTIRENLKGEQVYEANSISFAKMNEETFSEYYGKCLDVIVKYFNFDKQSIIDSVEQYF